MKNNKFNFLFYVQAALVLYAVLFAGGLLLDGTFPLLWFLLKMQPLVIVGNISLIFVNIPLAVVTLVLRAKEKFDRKYSVPVLVLSIINIITGIAAWVLLILFVLTKP